jgi:hypothetical protein
MFELLEIKKEHKGLQEIFQKNMPKVDIDFIQDPLRGSRAARNYILEKTCMAPAIYDNGTHYVTDQKLTLEMLKEISDFEDFEITGEYTGSMVGVGALHKYAHATIPDSIRGRINQ